MAKLNIVDMFCGGVDSFSFINIGGKSGYAYIPNQNNRKTVVTFVTEDGYEITTDNFMMKKILRENIQGEEYDGR